MENLALRLIGIALLLVFFYIINYSKRKKTGEICKRDLIKIALQKYKTEYVLILKWGSIATIIASILIDNFHIYIFSEDVSGSDLLILWFCLFFPISLGILIYRNIKTKDLYKDAVVSADSTVNSMILNINGKQFEIPQILLPFSIEKCVRIINEEMVNENSIAETDSISKNKYCKSCGNELIENDNFCNKCGEKIHIE